MIGNTKAFPLQLDKTIDKMFYNEFRRKQKYYTAIFKEEEAPRGAEYTEATLSELGLPREIGEGQGIEFDVPAEGNKITRYYKKHGMGAQVTEEMIQDELHGKWKQVPTALADSMIERQEFLAAAVLDGGFSTSTGEDGLALFADNHVTLKGGVTIDNLLSGDLSTTTIQAAFSYGDTLVGENGFIRPARPVGIVCHPANRWVINEILKAENRVYDYSLTGADRGNGIITTSTVESARASLNPLNPKYGIVSDWKVFLNPYLTDQDAWYVLFENYDLRAFWKKRPSLESSGDFITGNKVYKTTMRGAFFSNKYRAIAGSAGV